VQRRRPDHDRVVITGIGIVSPVGCAVKDFWSALVEARSGIGPITVIPTDGLLVRIAAQVLDFDSAAHFESKQANLLDRFAQFAVVAARSAVRDAELVINEPLALEAVTIVGSGVGGQGSMDDQYYKVYGQKYTKVHPLTIPRMMINAAASHISMDLGLKGRTYSVATACAAGTHAIGQAFHLLRLGQAPFATGLVLGEGAAILVLETRDHATARGARIYAEIVGFGMTADAADLTATDANGGARAMQAALRDSCVNPDDIDYVNAHGTGTDLNDRTESRALRQVFGAHADRLAVSSSKGVLGHSCAWHRAGFRRYWRWKSRNLGGRQISADLRALIRRMSVENLLWGAPRIHGELLKLGFAVA